MIPTESQALGLHKKYAWDNKIMQEVVLHCKITAEIALWCVKEKNLQVDKARLQSACLLHDIGSYVFLASKEKRRDTYPQHAIFGSAILREEGVDSQICEMVKTHVLLGLTKEEINQLNIALPYKNFEPQTIEARLLCYADRFSSKGTGLVINKFDTFLEKLKIDLPLQAKKFNNWSLEFGVPNTDYFAKNIIVHRFKF